MDVMNLKLQAAVTRRQTSKDRDRKSAGEADEEVEMTGAARAINTGRLSHELSVLANSAVGTKRMSEPNGSDI